MSLIRARNLLHEIAPQTRLTHAEVSGTTAIRVENSTALTESWAVQVGAVGGEQTEVVIGTPTNAGTIGVGALTYDHPADTPLSFIKYNQVVFERSTAGTTGTATPMTNGTISYQPDSEYTVFDDTSGSASYGYRTYFRNSVLAVNSTESDWITFAGHSFYSLAKIRERSKNKLWDASWLKDDIVDEWINEFKDELANAVIQTNEDYSLGTVNLAFGTNGLGTITTADFGQLRRVWVTYDGTNKYQSTKMNVNDFLPNQIFSATHPYHYFQGDEIIGIKPSDTAGTAELVFYRFGTTMVNDTDVLPLPMRPFTRSFTDYVKLNGQYKDEKATQENIDLFVAREKENFVTSITPRDKTGITMIDLLEPTGPAHPR